MTTSSLEEFNTFRAGLNDLIAGRANLTINRFFAVNSRAYDCDDCITYHVIRCADDGVTDEEMFEVFAVGLVVGGSIVIPHLRRAAARLEEVRASA
jgi:AhpD family alkylhydroperoxidase